MYHITSVRSRRARERVREVAREGPRCFETRLVRSRIFPYTIRTREREKRIQLRKDERREGRGRVNCAGGNFPQVRSHSRQAEKNAGKSFRRPIKADADVLLDQNQPKQRSEHSHQIHRLYKSLGLAQTTRPTKSICRRRSKAKTTLFHLYSE
jgi:hypothetical protein